jgi:hypothetical protein
VELAHQHGLFTGDDFRQTQMFSSAGKSHRTFGRMNRIKLRNTTRSVGPSRGGEA